jgi:glycosyltransferase involved in cell wall biosynthesis
LTGETATGAASAAPPRVLHCPLLVGGNPGQLALAEREIGLRSLCVSFSRHPFGYPCDEVLWDTPGSVIANELQRLRLLWRAVREFDVIHFNFGMSILPTPHDDSVPRGTRAWGLWRLAYNGYASLVQHRDLPLLKKLGKALFVTYQGDDARQGDYCKAHFSVSPVGEVDAGYYTPESDARKRRDIADFGRYADGLYALNPDLLHVLPQGARFLPYGHVDPRLWPPAAPAGAGSRPLVVHAPSHRGVKGTRVILEAVSRLRAEGIEFDFTLVEGLRNDEARRIYERADLVIDQILVGWYGGLAVECMALARPVICYLREEDLRFIEPEMRSQLPVIRAEPSTLCDVLRECLTTRRRELPEIGARGRAYVERWHDPLRIARFLRDQYESALRRNGRAIRDPLPRAGATPAVSPPDSGRRHILVIWFSTLADDPRVSRQLRLLAGRFRVTAAGLLDPRIPGVEFVPLPYVPRSPAGKILGAAQLKLGLFERYYWASGAIVHALRALQGTNFDLILANDLNTLPLASRLESRHGIVFDAHEYAPREYEDSLLWRFLFQRYNDYLCRRYLPAAKGMLTVCQGIADEYRANYGVEPAVLMNAPPYYELAPRPASRERIRMVHHGVVIPARKLELMMEVMEHLDERFVLDLYLVPDRSRYFARLASLAAKHPRIRILPPVPMLELPQRLNEYDVGLYLLPHTTFNYKHVLPNKFFEFIQARLAVAIGPSPEMARLTRHYDCGIVSDDFNPQSLARRLNALDAARIDYYKQRSHRAARDLCFERNSEVLLGMVDRLLGGA